MEMTMEHYQLKKSPKNRGTKQAMKYLQIIRSAGESLDCRLEEIMDKR